MNSYTSTDYYCSVISIAFGFEFVMEAELAIGKMELRHSQEHKAIVRSTC
jgi:hypothetical protein